MTRLNVRFVGDDRRDGAEQVGSGQKTAGKKGKEKEEEQQADNTMETEGDGGQHTSLSLSTKKTHSKATTTPTTLIA